MFVLEIFENNNSFTANSHEFFHLLNVRPTLLCSELSPESNATGILKIGQLLLFLQFSLSLGKLRSRPRVTLYHVTTCAGALCKC